MHHLYADGYAVQLVAQLLAFPMGRIWAHVVPHWTLFGISLNPGPFTIKEHVCL